MPPKATKVRADKHASAIKDSHTPCDAEYNPETGMKFGFANLADDANAEWREFSISDLESIEVWGGAMGVERELHWRPKPFLECDAVRERSTQPLSGDGTEAATVNDPILESGSVMNH